MSIEEEVDRLIDERTGRELLNVPYDEEAVQVHERVYRSAGATASSWRWNSQRSAWACRRLLTA